MTKFIIGLKTAKMRHQNYKKSCVNFINLITKSVANLIWKWDAICIPIIISASVMVAHLTT